MSSYGNNKELLFVFQLSAHVVFGGSNVFELQLSLHGVSVIAFPDEDDSCLILRQ